MTTFQNIREKYSDYAPAFPDDWEKPSEEELKNIQETYNINYSQEFIQFQLSECHNTPMGDFAFDYFGWASPELGPMENLRVIVNDAQEVGVPENLAPFKCDNGDYYCITQDGGIVIWDHNANSIETNPAFQWESFCEWLRSSLDE